MFKDLEIQNYRQFSSLKLDGLGRVNLLVGANNVGKTAVLEAIQILCQPGMVRGNGLLDLLRGTDKQIPSLRMSAGWWFHKQNLDADIVVKSTEPSRSIVISLSDEPKGIRHSIQFQEQTPWHLNITETIRGASSTRKFGMNHGQVNPQQWFQNPIPLTAILPDEPSRDLKKLAEWYSKLDLAGRHTDLLKVMQSFEPKLKRFSVVNTNAIFLAADAGNGLMPVSYFGDGFVRTLALATRLTEAKGGVLMVDEIETGLYRAAMDHQWQFLRNASQEQNVQVFATTHSVEALSAACAAFADEPDALVLYRLERQGEKVVPVRISRNELDKALENGWEMR